MKTTLCSIITRLTFITLALVPNSFAQATEPHNIVRLIYFIPSGRTPDPDINAKFDKLIKNVQTFFGDEMERHEFGRKTFVFEADSDGNAVVHRVNGNFPDVHYRMGTVREEVSQRFDFSKNVYFMVVDVSHELRVNFCGYGGHANENWDGGGGDRGGSVFMASGVCFTGEGTFHAAHELGHAFGLFHDFRNDNYLMSYGDFTGVFTQELAPCSAEWFNASRYFNNSHQTPPNSGETRIEMLPPTVSPTDGIRFQFKVSDIDGLQIAHLITPQIGESIGGLAGCKNLTGESQTVEFVTTELTRQSTFVILRIVDSEDNLAQKHFQIDTATLFTSDDVLIPDSNLASAIRNALRLESWRTITQLDMLGLRELRAYNAQITNLTGLEHARNLKYLYLRSNQIRDITPIMELSNLLRLDLSENPIDDISSVTELTQLWRLTLDGYQFHDLTPFARLTNLRYLSLANNQISDVTLPTGLTNLGGLYLSGNQISDITPLAELTNLYWLWLSNNQINDISPLAELTNLEELQLSSNHISDIIPLAGLTNLYWLWLSNNQINDISPLAELTNLEELQLSSNHISDIIPLAGLTNLYWLDLSINQISDVNPLAGLVNLRYLYLQGNPIKDQGPLLALLRRNPDLKIDIDLDVSNNAPMFTNGSTTTRSLEEHTGAGVNIGRPVAATDADNDSLTYTLSGTDAALFDINSTTGQLKTRATLDYETKSSYTVTVTVSDGKLTDEITVTINVSNVNEAPVFTAGSSTARTVAEHTGAGVNIGLPVAAADADNDSLTYALSGTDAALFDINSTTGQLKTRATLDYETKLSYTVTVTVSDGKLTDEIMVTINVSNVNEAPVFTAGSSTTRTVTENTRAGVNIGHPVTATDADSDDTLTYSLGGTDAASFDIDSTTGQLQTKMALDYETQDSYTVTVTVIDADDLTAEIMVTVNLTDVAEFLLLVPAGISLIHVPLKVTAVDGVAKTIESVGDLYDALGGAATVSLLITYDPETGRWNSYLHDGYRGRPGDKTLTDDLGIIASMKGPKSVLLSGDALGTNGRSSITLHPGINLVGVPLKDSRITRVSNLLKLNGIAGNVSVIIVSDNGFKVVAQAEDPGDILVTGGGAFILTALRPATVDIIGTKWSTPPGQTAAPSSALSGIQTDGVTPVLAVSGSISPVGRKSLSRPFHVTVKNRSTGTVDTATIDEDGVSYQFTFVDIETGRAGQVGDILEITAYSPDPFVGVQPVWHTVTDEDVKRSWISLVELVAYEIPAKTELLSNYPNPFNPETWIPYRLAKDAFVTLTIYDRSGHVVREIDVGHRIAAVYESRSKAVHWDGRTEFGERVASGIYFYTLTAGDYSATRKMVILK